MTPMAAIAAALLTGRDTSGKLLLLDRPLFKYGALAMGVGELFGDKMKSAPDRTVFWAYQHAWPVQELRAPRWHPG